MLAEEVTCKGEERKRNRRTYASLWSSTHCSWALRTGAKTWLPGDSGRNLGGDSLAFVLCASQIVYYQCGRIRTSATSSQEIRCSSLAHPVFGSVGVQLTGERADNHDDSAGGCISNQNKLGPLEWLTVVCVRDWWRIEDWNTYCTADVAD